MGAGAALIVNAQAPPKAAPKAAPAAAAAKPPKPGLASCAGKIEGRYAASNGTPYTIEFRSGKASVNVPVMGAQETTCWTAAKKIYLYIPNDADPMEIDINDDGTLQTAFGELKKKGS
jgi:hypothetical protein